MLRNAIEARGSEEQDVIKRLSLVGRFGTTDEIARAVLWLCSDQSTLHDRARPGRRRGLPLAVTAGPGVAFTPIRVGTLDLDRRLVVPAHSGGGGSLLGPEPLFERHCAYWTARIRGGAAWVGGGPTFVPTR